MKKAFTNILWGTLLMSAVSTIVIIFSFSTEYWIFSSAVSGDQNRYFSEINYGLIFGTIVRRLEVSTGTVYRLTIGCSLGNNVCAYSCLDNEAARTTEIAELYDTGAVTFSCQSIRSQYSSDSSGGYIKLQDNSTSAGLEELHHRFINATIWLGTIVCLCVTGLLCLISCLITALNIYYEPIKTFLTLQGLYIWHGVAGLTALITLCLWGSMFLMRLNRNVATVDTIMGTLSSEHRASLGFSFWLNVLPVLFEGSCVGLLYYRQRLFETKPHDTVPIGVQPSISHLY